VLGEQVEHPHQRRSRRILAPAVTNKPSDDHGGALR
jgi:hypothetical protein